MADEYFLIKREKCPECCSFGHRSREGGIGIKNCDKCNGRGYTETHENLLDVLAKVRFDVVTDEGERIIGLFPADIITRHNLRIED